MASSYPGALDTLANPDASDAMNDGAGHAANHTAANDAIEAIQATLGVDPQGSETTVADRLAAVEGGGGGGGALVLIADATFTGGSTGTIDAVFDATYDDYMVIINDLDVSGTDVELTMCMRTSGTDNTTSNYTCITMYLGGSSGVKAGSSGRADFHLGTASTANNQSIQLFIGNPFAAKHTSCSMMPTVNYPGSGPYLALMAGSFKATTSFDGLKLTISSGTMAGTIRVYGYAK